MRCRVAIRRCNAMEQDVCRYVGRYDGVKKESVLSGNRYELTAGSWMLVGHRLQVDMQRSKIGVGQHGS